MPTHGSPTQRGRENAPEYGRGLVPLALAAVATVGVALGLIFFYAPEEAQEGFLQRIFYLHVPLAIVCLCGFVIAGAMAIQHLRTRDPRWDLRSYTTIHISLVFAVAVLISGSIWARGSWGHWWVWSEPTLVSFLIIFLLYATYQPLRFSIEDPERQARYASVFAVAAGAFVPIAYAAVQMSSAYLHPRVLGPTYAHLPAAMGVVFAVSLVAFALLFTTLCRFEMAAKRARWRLRAARAALLGETDLGARPRTAQPSLGAPPSPRPAVDRESGALVAHTQARSI
ncbi:MAG: cytochrome c biogenesis protein [Solirubrobacteraceae bacterium]